MATRTAAGPSERDLISVVVDGDAAKAHSLGLTVAGETLEDVVKEITAENVKGIRFFTELLKRLDSRWGKHGLNAMNHGVAAAIARKVTALMPGLDPGTRVMAQVFLGDFLAGVGKGVIAASDPNREQKIDALGAQVARRFGNAFRDALGVVHLARLAADGSMDVDAKGRPQACSHWQQMTSGWDLLHPDTTQTTGGNQQQRGQPRQTTRVPGALIPYQVGDFDALAGNGEPHVCPECLRLNGAAQPKAQSFWARVRADEKMCRVLVAAARRDSGTDREGRLFIDLSEDLAAKGDFDALAIVCHDIDPRLVDTRKSGVHQCFEIKNADAKLLRAWFDGPGGAELGTGNKAREATHGAIEAVKRALKHGGLAAWAAAAFAIGIPVAYFIVAVPIVGIYGAGVFGWWQNQHWNVGLTLAGSILALLWLLPWYSVAGLVRVFGGIFHPHADEHGSPSLANSARNITAYLFGLGVTAMLIADMGILFGFPTFLVRLVTIPVIALALIAYDRIGARWGHDSEEIHHLLEKLSLGNIRTLATVSAALAVIGIGPLAYKQYVDGNIAFQVAVVEQEITVQVPKPGGKDGETEEKTIKVKYIATPSGGAFRVEDILGAVGAQSATVGEVCVPKGTDIDLPGYVEKEIGGCASGVGYAVRKHLFGRFLDEGPQEYSSIEALYFAQEGEKAEMKEVMEAAAAPDEPAKKPEAKPADPAPKATVSAVSPAAASTKPAAPVTKRGVDCSKLSARARAEQEACK
ncbi:hypothetical protein A2348_01765 [Candidatus Uhrbacteria bacterium RIFOXYB12_FULL_58_10]|uniref:Uncharacterized protein n=1 Tax=Candidatus Uhrbacteria bacterium RIFOXYB2_FULL_57_15 TaxID=1802422 RepID=A0A1F7W6N5_9BACT|nr:MAG: hypothetical protein A2348_01765 [Candidatus Uhrbacteria bacterium RIFOXYB12_FULL_58_10]OGL97847.1 MAG: hypothetical protein A2304_04670 [Candidatus Uhrbacteria bacterium RIFOXYB2_FULL_57_15]OGM00456.1 MAG: hypothetical protein A2501_00635 [Candidatus Uhrbacteria bacterium RIFOXYC12_FULL_57_11]